MRPTAVMALACDRPHGCGARAFKWLLFLMVATATSLGLAETSCPVGQIKWHPGVYVWLDPNRSQSQNLSVINDIAQNCSGCTGFLIEVPWAAIETSQGVYTTSAIAPYVSQATAGVNGYRNLRVMLRIPSVVYSGSGAAPCSTVMSGLLPGYVSSYADGGCYVCTPGCTAYGIPRVDEAEITTRMIALSKFLAQQYDANPYFELFDPYPETSLPGIYMPNYETQAQSFFTAARSHWPHTNLRWEVNYLTSDDADMASQLQFAVNNRIVVGGPDTAPLAVRSIQADWVWGGFNSASGATSTRNSLYADQQNVGAWVAEIEEIQEQWCYMNPSCSLSNLATAAYGMQNSDQTLPYASYIIWFYNDYQGGSTYEWSAERALINAGGSPVRATACPPSYTAGCNEN